jgi:xylulokinase
VKAARPRPDATDLLLGIDICTMSSKGVLARPDGDVVATVERPHQLSLPRQGYAEHDAQDIWWADAVAISRELSAAARTARGRIAAVCTSGIGACVLPADRDGTPLRPAILYGIDTRAGQEIAELDRRFGADAVLERCGSRLTTQSAGPKLLWVRHHEPDVWERTARFFMASSFLVHRLTGQYVLDHHSASQCEPLYDITRQDWIPEWAQEVAPGLELPRLTWPGEIVGSVTPRAQDITGIPAGTPVAAGTIDAWSEALSVGVQQPGDRMLMYGTTMFIIEVLQGALRHPALWGTVGIMPGTNTLAGGMATSGALTAWIRDLCGGVPYEELTQQARAVPAGSDALVVLPYFAGERTPIFDPDARGSIVGLTLSHGRGHLYRAVLEATAYGIRHTFEVMRAAGGSAEQLVAVGGGTKGGLWTQIVSDVTGIPQQVPEQTIGASYGDALLAARAVGLAKPDTDWTRIAHTVEPDERHRALYQELYHVYRELYPATRDYMHRLARKQRPA